MRESTAIWGYIQISLNPRRSNRMTKFLKSLLALILNIFIFNLHAFTGHFQYGKHSTSHVWPQGEKV